MSIQRQICDALCKGFQVHQVPMGFAIGSPFDWFTGDGMAFYARTKGALLRFEDSGSTVFDLEGMGVDLSNPSRLQSLLEICADHGVHYDEEECIFYSDYVKPEEVGLAAIKFMSFMLRVQDMLLTVRHKVASTFKEDLVAAISERFGTDEVAVNDVPVADLSYYVVDIVVRHKGGKIAAIFPATSEEKVLSATLFAKDLELKNIDNVVPFLVFEHSNPKKITRDTQAKAMNSELELATWDGGHADVLEKIGRHIR